MGILAAQLRFNTPDTWDKRKERGKEMNGNEIN